MTSPLKADLDKLEALASAAELGWLINGRGAIAALIAALSPEVVLELVREARKGQAMQRGACPSGTACSVASLPEPEVSALRVPPGWRVESGIGFDAKRDRWACIRHLESQCGQDFYEDRDPLVFAFLSAIQHSAIGEQGKG